MPLTFESYYAILVGGIILLAAAIWLQKAKTTASLVAPFIVLSVGLALVLFPTAVRLRDVVSQTTPDRELLSWQLNYLRQTYEMQAEEFTRELLAQPKYQDPRNLNRYEAKIYSQSGEDGIIAEIFRRVGTTNKFFVEFGSSDGSENNTVYLLSEGWGGLWIDGDVDAVQRATGSFAEYVKKGTLVIEPAFITAENIESMFVKAKVPSDLDLLSIDIDRNDYYVWRSINQYRPRVAIIEYNAIFPPGVRWVVPYDANAWWDGTSRYGASLTSLELLGREKGYELVGCSLSGTNAFFVRKDLVGDKFLSPHTAAVHQEPPRYFLAYRIVGHPRRP